MAMDSEDYEILIKGYKEEVKNLKKKISDLEGQNNVLWNKNNRMLECLRGDKLLDFCHKMENLTDDFKDLNRDIQINKKECS